MEERVQPSWSSLLKESTVYHKTLYPRDSVIIFDEVQKCPMARQAIKYLVADHRYDYIETGSLISIKKNTENITIREPCGTNASSCRK